MKRILSILISVILGFIWVGQSLAMEFDELGGIDIHGFISQGFLKSSDNNFFADTEDGTTQFNEAGINFSTDITDRLRIGMQLFARDLGSLGNNEVILDWAVADYRWRDWLGLRVGNLKFITGLYNETRDVDMLRTNIFLPQGVYNESWRESSTLIQGAELYGDIPMRILGSFSYAGQYGTINIAPDKGAARLLEDQWPAENPVLGGLSIDVHDIDVDSSYTGQLLWQTPMDGLVLGISGWGYSFKATCDTILNVQSVMSPAVGGKSIPEVVLLYDTFVPAGARVNNAIIGNAYTTLVTAGQIPPGQESLSAVGSGLYFAEGVNDALPELTDTYRSIGNLGTAYPGLTNLKSFPLQDSIFDADTISWTASAEFTWRGLVLAGEYTKTTYEISWTNPILAGGQDATLPDGTVISSFPGGVITVPKFDAVGWYGSAAYRFTYWFETGFYYSEYYPNNDDRTGEKRVNEKYLDTDKNRAWLKDTCMTLRFDINENWVLKLEGHLMNGTAALHGYDNPKPPEDSGQTRYEEDWILGAAKITYSF